MKLGIIFPIKDKKFGLRLKSLMDYNDMTEADLAVKMCGFSSKPSFDDTDNYKSFASAKRSIQNHLKIDDLNDAKKIVTSRYLINYCKILDCEPDFLFGYIDFPKHTETDINEKLGLSKKAIKTLLSCKNGNILADENFHTMDLLNFILSDQNLFSFFLNYLGLYVNNTYNIPCYSDPNTHLATPLPDDHVRDKSFISGKNERYIAIGKKQEKQVCGNDAYQTIMLPVSALTEPHALHMIENVIDEWKKKYPKK